MIQTLSELSKTSELVHDFINSSEKFLKIITFRFSSKQFADMFIDKAKKGITVEIITTPADNIAEEDLRTEVEKMYGLLQESGVKLSTCPWEVGEPRLTPTSLSGELAAGIGEKWYSLHFQLFLNDKHALLTSQNLVPEKTLEVYYLSSNPHFLKETADKFKLVNELFFTPVKVEVNNATYTLPGKLTDFLDELTLKDTIDLFVKSKRYKVKHYSINKLPQVNLTKGLFICPFEGRLREFLYKFIDSGEVFLYFFVETFFDEDLIRKIEEKIHLQPKIKIKIITRPPQKVRQAPAKARNMINQILSLGVGVGFLPDIQAKFWVNDKWLAIPSGDFNKMNLGYQTSKNYWRADTQLLLLDNDEEQVKMFKNIFEEQFEAMDIGSICINDVKPLFSVLKKRYSVRSTAEAIKYISRLKSSLAIRTEEDIRYVINLSVKLTKSYGKQKIEGIFALMAIILYYLQRREHKFEEILEKLENIAEKSNVVDAVNRLLMSGYILKSQDVYRVNVQRLI
jgi:hypothetical protein